LLILPPGEAMIKIKTAIAKSTEAALAELESIRNEIAEIDGEIYWLENAPLPLDDALNKIRKSIAARAMRATGVEGFFSNYATESSPFETQASLTEARVIDEAGGALIGSGRADIGDILCLLFGENLEDKLGDLAKAAAADIESGPPLIERAGLKAELLGKKKTLEIAEEKLIETAEELGLQGFYRRADCDPKIVLMLD
jgi:hypothetical protein